MTDGITAARRMAAETETAGTLDDDRYEWALVYRETDGSIHGETNYPAHMGRTAARVGRVLARRHCRPYWVIQLDPARAVAAIPAPVQA